MRVSVVDADLIGRKRHRFPNLVCMKLSGYHKGLGDDVRLVTNWDDALDCNIGYVSKVFTDTPVPDWVLNPPPHIHIGGTGFFFDKAPPLPDAVEHHMPDYHLYDEWLMGIPEKETVDYRECSIGFMTRGCFRKCAFCVNQKYDHVFQHSPLEEFYDPERKRICLLDDNFFGCPKWREMLQQLIGTGKPFRFKQGLDERLLTDEMCEMLFNAKYDGDFTFAFDKIKDYDLIERKLQMIRRHTNTTRLMFYVLVGFESTDAQDIVNAWRRIELLMRYGAKPYIMRYQNRNDAPWKASPYRDMYIQMARWCNQQSFFKKQSFREWAFITDQRSSRTGADVASVRAIKAFEAKHPDIAKRYFDLKFEEVRDI